MKNHLGFQRLKLLVQAVFWFAAAGNIYANPALSDKSVEVSGTGTDLLSSALVHSKKATASGEIQKSTEIVELNGDLKGKVLYHVTTVIDAKKNTLINTGDQVFSGTVVALTP